MGGMLLLLSRRCRHESAVVTRIGYVIAVILVAVYLTSTLTGPKGMAALVEKQRRIQAMEKRNVEIARDIEQRRQRIQGLRNDQDEQENGSSRSGLSTSARREDLHVPRAAKQRAGGLHPRPRTRGRGAGGSALTTKAH